jgi:4-hydroxymandelate oxidase
MHRNDRRRLLQYLAASPLLPYLSLSPSITTALEAGAISTSPDGSPDAANLITSCAEALSVFDFEPVARRNLPIAHYGYMLSGTDDDGTERANREAFTKYELRVRRLIDISKIDTSVKLLDKQWRAPIVICPVGALDMYHANGELEVARAAEAQQSLQVLSTATTTAIEEVIAARGEPVWFQLYVRKEWPLTRKLIKRAEAAGAPALVFTLDALAGRNLETARRFQRSDPRPCAQCHERPPPALDDSRLPMVADLIPSAAMAPDLGTPTWDYVKRLQDTTSMKLFLKGVVTREDAELAMEHRVAGVFVSNHGGRAENSLRATLECLREVVAGIRGRAPVIIDGGLRRGTDIFKALALGATAIGIGRPYLWGLAAFGQEGVETVLEIMRRELELVMRQAGTTSLRAITSAYVMRA